MDLWENSNNLTPPFIIFVNLYNELILLPTQVYLRWKFLFFMKGVVPEKHFYIFAYVTSALPVVVRYCTASLWSIFLRQ